MKFSTASNFRARDEYNNMSDEEMDKDAFLSMLALDLAELNRRAVYIPIRCVVEHLMKLLGGSENVADFTSKNKIEEKNAFMNGKKQIAIISEAASCGISLQAHKDFANKSKRLHITLELPWSADKAIEQLGRTHRSNQVCAPDYVFLTNSWLPGESHNASVVAKRIESMNAVAHLSHLATKSYLSGFNMEMKSKVIQFLKFKISSREKGYIHNNFSMKKFN
jgi:hypothetical protein